MNPSEYQDIGQYLRDSRESLRISLAHAAHDLHIRAKYLAALEAGNLNDMPGKAYIRGYIRNYAQYLHLDTNEVLDAYAFLLGPKSQELFIPAQTLEQHLPTRKLVGFSLASLFLLYGVWFFTIHDRTKIGHMVSDLPADLMQKLYDTPSLPISKPWKDCLSSTDEICAITLQQQVQLPFYAASYPLSILTAPYSPPPPPKAIAPAELPESPALPKAPVPIEALEPSARPQDDDVPMQEPDEGSGNVPIH